MLKTKETVEKGKKTKVLIITEGYFPGRNYGGPPVSIDNFCTLMDKFECLIIARNHDLGETKKYEDIGEGWVDRGNCKVLYIEDDKYGIVAFEKVICEQKPDIIYLQSLFQSCILPTLVLAKRYNIKVLLAPRGELCKGAFKKKYKKIPYLCMLKILRLLTNVYFQSTSEEENTALKRYLKIDHDELVFLTNIPSVTNCRIEHTDKKEGEAKFIFLSRIHPKKNLLQAINSMKNVEGNVTLDIYGPLEDKNYWDLCQKVIADMPNNIIVRYCGIVSHDMVHEVFSRYDAFIFPTLSENYGHVIIEALVSGCPVIVSDRTPWGRIESEGAGFVCELNDLSAFEKAIQKIVDVKDSSYKLCAQQYAQKCLDLEEIKKNYHTAFTKILN